MATSKLFVYGILKRGFSLDLEARGQKFLGKASIVGATLYGLGYKYPNGEFSGVGLRLDGEDTPENEAQGELFEIDDRLWPYLDGIESNGFAYTRKEVTVCLHKVPSGDDLAEIGLTVAWVYEHTYPGAKYGDHNRLKDNIFRNQKD